MKIVPKTVRNKFREKSINRSFDLFTYLSFSNRHEKLLKEKGKKRKREKEAEDDNVKSFFYLFSTPHPHPHALSPFTTATATVATVILRIR